MNTLLLILVAINLVLIVVAALQRCWYAWENHKAIKRLDEWERRAGRPLMDRRNLPGGRR